MKVFISSVVRGYEKYREAAAEGVKTLDCQVVRSENLPAQPDTPQQACLREVRGSDAVILLLGERYGAKQDSGLSATQEEYNEAKKNNIPVLVFIESDIKPELAQEEFIKNAKDWTSGIMVNMFSDSKQLKEQVIKALHQLVLQESKAISVDNATERAKDLLSAHHVNYRPRLLFGLVVSPQQQIFRPSELGGNPFIEKIRMCGEKGEFPILKEQIPAEYRNKTIVIKQLFSLLSINQQSDIYIALDLSKNNLSPRNGLTNVIIEEHIAGLLYSCLHFCRCILEPVDAIRDMSSLVVAVCIKDNQYTPWRTQQKHMESPNRMTITDNYKEMMPEVLGPFTFYALEKGLNEICDDLVSTIKHAVHQG